MTTPDDSSEPWAENVTDFIAREHEIVRENLDHMRAILEATPDEVPLTLRSRLDVVFSFLHADLLSLMTLEEQTLYPAVERISDEVHATKALALDHEAIRRVIAELDDLAGASGWKRWGAGLQQRLFGLEVEIRHHMDREERDYGPLLSRLDPDDHAILYARLAAHFIEHGHDRWVSSES